MRRFVFLFVLLGTAVFLSAQASITRFAVVDMNRIFSAFAEQSADAKAFNEKRNKVQAEIDRMNRELQDLNARLEEAKAAEKRDQIRSLENQIKAKIQSTKNYIDTRYTELERDREQLSKNESFTTQINNVLRLVAESEGYSMILSKSDTGILWYSPSVDITNKVIERIRTGTTRR
ncbi:outer membrane protein [Spirochaetia bacterium]|nr:outer membrane protein [Spirochaetia bacterium]